MADLYTGLEAVFNRINSFDFDYEKDEMEARQKFIPVQQLQQNCTDRAKLPMQESYNLKIQLDRAVTWLVDKINDSNLDPISITPADLDQYEDIQNALLDKRSL